MANGRQIAHRDEAIVLRTWPFHEADLLVSLFTRDEGKVKGVARYAMRSRKRFGGALEPGTVVRATWVERPKQDLVRLDAFEILWSPLLWSPQAGAIDAQRLAAMQLVVEVLEEAMPEGAADDNVFRLAAATLAAMRDGEVWLPVTYFALWMNRLMGWMPELGHCAACGLDLRGTDVWWSPQADGVTCHDDRRSGSTRLSAAAVDASRHIIRKPLAEIDPWPEAQHHDLRTFALGVLERHLDRRLRSATTLR